MILLAVALSALFLGDKPSLPVLLTLLPIVGGVGLASVSEVRQGRAGSWSPPTPQPPRGWLLTNARVVYVGHYLPVLLWGQGMGGMSPVQLSYARQHGALVPQELRITILRALQVTFNWKGFLSAMGSNLTFQSRNVLSKKFMTKGKLLFQQHVRWRECPWDAWAYSQADLWSLSR